VPEVTEKLSFETRKDYQRDGRPELWHVVLDPNGADPMKVWAQLSSFHE
jgi:hypothetical protein